MLDEYIKKKADCYLSLLFSSRPITQDLCDNIVGDGDVEAKTFIATAIIYKTYNILPRKDIEDRVYTVSHFLVKSILKKVNIGKDYADISREISKYLFISYQRYLRSCYNCKYKNSCADYISVFSDKGERICKKHSIGE